MFERRIPDILSQIDSQVFCKEIGLVQIRAHIKNNISDWMITHVVSFRMDTLPKTNIRNCWAEMIIHSGNGKLLKVGYILHFSWISCISDFRTFPTRSKGEEEAGRGMWEMRMRQQRLSIIKVHRTKKERNGHSAKVTMHPNLWEPRMQFIFFADGKEYPRDASG